MNTSESKSANPPQPLPGWSTISVAGKPCDIFEPANPSPHGFAIVYLHGVHVTRLVDNPVFTALFQQYGLRVMSPITSRCWWADRICPDFDSQLTPERHVLKNIVRWMRDHWSSQPPHIGLLGTSMGGQGALRISFKHPNVFPVVAAISPAIDYQVRWNEGDETLQAMYDDAESIRQDTATLHIHPLNWPRNIWFCCDPTDYRWHESAERLRSKLAALGIPHERDLETTGGGHGAQYYHRMLPAAMKFIVDRLERERLRVA